MVTKRWSQNAYEALKHIHDFYRGRPENAKKVVGNILSKIDQLHFTHQFQTDEILGPPYRRIMIKNHRIVYKVVDQNLIEILDIFDNRQSPKKLKQRIRK